MTTQTQKLEVLLDAIRMARSTLKASPASKTFTSRYVIVGLNAALEKRVLLDNLVVGDVNLALSIDVGIGGDGQNVALASSCLKLKESPCLLQFVGKGYEGDMLLTALQIIDPPVSLLTVRTRGKCRTYLSLVAGTTNRTNTGIIEPADIVTPEEIASLLEEVENQYIHQYKSASGMVVMGSLPPGCPASIYGDLIMRCCDSNSKIILGTMHGLKDALNSGFAAEACLVMKVKLEELQTLCGSIDIVRTAITTQEVVQLVHQTLDKFGVPTTYAQSVAFVLTNGPNPAYFVSTGEDRVCLRILGRQTLAVLVNDIGANDAVAAGMLHHWTRNLKGGYTSVAVHPDAEYLYQNKLTADDHNIVQAFAYGLACGSASCLTEINGQFNVEDASRIQMDLEIIL